LDDGCISDNDAGLDYKTWMDCRFSYYGDATITSTDFEIETMYTYDWEDPACHDFMMIDGQKYCEDGNYVGRHLSKTFPVTGKTEFIFKSDFSTEKKGFHFCAERSTACGDPSGESNADGYEWECSLNEGCLWSSYDEGKDFGFYSAEDGDCTRCKSLCDNDNKCWAIECGAGYCSWWKAGVCQEKDNDVDEVDSDFLTCRNPTGVIDSLAGLEAWCSDNASNCITCRGEYDGSNCQTNPNVIAKCRKFKGNDVCDRIAGCRSVTNKNGKTKCKGRKHGLA